VILGSRPTEAAAQSAIFAEIVVPRASTQAPVLPTISVESPRARDSRLLVFPPDLGRMNGSRVTPKVRSQRKSVAPDLGFSWGPVNSLLLGLAVAVLVVGFLALSRGSITLAPVLLVLGYCGLIPASLLIRGRNQGPGE
jgi:hypothetical protein